MGEISIWFGIAVGGVLVLGVVEYVRTNAAITARREDLITTLMAVVLVIFTVIAAFVAIAYVIVMLLFDYWEYALIAALVITGIVTLAYHYYSRPPL